MSEVAMPFDWMSTKVPPEVAAAGAAKFKGQIVAEARERAQLLRRLGHSRPYAELRCRRNILWAFDGVGRSPVSDTEVKAIVAEVYK